MKNAIDNSENGDDFDWDSAWNEDLLRRINEKVLNFKRFVKRRLQEVVNVCEEDSGNSEFLTILTENLGDIFAKAEELQKVYRV